MNQFGKLDPTPLQRITEAISYRFANARRVRKVAAAALVLAGLGLLVIDVADPHEVAVVVTVHDLAPGHVIAAADVELHKISAPGVPDGAARSPDDVVGRTLAGGARAGEVLTDVRTLSPRLAALATEDPDARIVAIRVADPAIALLLRVGDRVDVIAAADDDRPRHVATDAAVLLVPDPERMSGNDGPVILLALPGSKAADVARASLSGRVTVTLS